MARTCFLVSTLNHRRIGYDHARLPNFNWRPFNQFKENGKWLESAHKRALYIPKKPRFFSTFRSKGPILSVSCTTIAAVGAFENRSSVFYLDRNWRVHPDSVVRSETHYDHNISIVCSFYSWDTSFSLKR